ncbi:MAG: aminopeptidase, partial [Flavobacteriaceae bacterium]|nr:aminopeptidase [Flavobacteriaceae bacterium]
NKYKAGLGLQYLDNYLNDSIVPASIRRFYLENKGKPSRSYQFEELITKKTDKDVCWFFGDYIHSKKKIDYTIRKVKQTGDSVKVTIKNNRNFTVPVALYGVKGKDVVFTKWLPGIDSTTTITLPKGDYDRLSLNYEYIYPELNLRDNWKNLSGLFNKPVQFRFFKDVEDPYFNQVFYNIFTNYNYYDGFIFGPRIYNESLIKKKWIYKITPTYGTSSKKLTGSFSLIYQYIPEETSVYRVTAGIAGSKFHYAPELNYQRLSPFAVVEFKRKSLRDVGGKAISARYVFVNKQVAPDAISTDQDNYQIFDIGYAYSKPDLINDFRFGFDYQLADKFSKVSADIRYRKLTEKSRQYDFRVFLGAFINNKTNSDYFSFALDRPSDYLFDYDYLGRSEQSGFFSQQIIIAEGGFKSKFENPYANQWMLTTNQSVSIWRWIELYADAGVYKSKGMDPQFLYDSGIRLNFIHSILEVYFPIQSSLGFEPTQGAYASKIRFVLTVNPTKIINFVRRGL